MNIVRSHSICIPATPSKAARASPYRVLLQELRERASPGSRGAHHPYGDPHYLNEFPLRRVQHGDEHSSRAPQLASQRARPFVLGYTGE